jgi:hypothetical protein
LRFYPADHDDAAMKRIVKGQSLENRDSFRIMFGGAPITRHSRDRSARTGYSADCAAAAVLARISRQLKALFSIKRLFALPRFIFTIRLKLPRPVGTLF